MADFDEYYEPKYLFDVLKKIQPVNAFFKTNYFKETYTFPTPTVSFEFLNRGRTTAHFLNPDEPVKPIKRRGYTMRPYTPPLIGGARIIQPVHLVPKMAGEIPWNSGYTEADRAARMVAEDLDDLQRAIQRREEYLCARLKQDGKIEINADGFTDEVNYGFTNIEEVASSDQWTSSYDILGKLQEVTRGLLKTGTNADMAVMGIKAADALMSNTKISKLLDNRRMNFGDISPVKIAKGTQYLGKLAYTGLYLDLFVYDDYYEDEDGGVYPYMDEDTVIIQASDERNMMLYGSVTYLDDDKNYVSVMGEYVPYVVATFEPPVRKLNVCSRPLPMPRDPDSWFVLKKVA